MMQVAAHTHYMPEHWRGKAHTVEVRTELLGLFHYKAQLFLEVQQSRSSCLVDTATFESEKALFLSVDVLTHSISMV